MAACPTPWKMFWTTRRAAIQHSKQAKSPQKCGQVRPYHCACGHWHVTSMTKQAVKAVKRRNAQRRAA